MRARTVGAITAALLAASAIAGCASSSSTGGGGSSTAGASHDSLLGVVTPTRSAKSAGSAAGTPAQGGAVQDTSVKMLPEPLPKQPSTVIFTGRLSLVSGKAIGNAVRDADRIATALGGYIVSSGTAGTKHRSSTIVIRVPAARFQKAMDDLRGLGGGKVLSDQRDGQDVSQEFVDLGARARNLKAQARALIRLMSRAVSVSDTIRVQNELFQVQGQIDQIEGRLRYLHDQADMSTITVSLRQSRAPSHAHHGKPSAIGSALRRGWHHAVGVVSAVIVGAGVVIPVALLAALALLAGMWLRPLLRRRLHPEPEVPAAE